MVERCAQIGDWEGDLTVGRISRSAIDTLPDKRTAVRGRVPLPNGHGDSAPTALRVPGLEPGRACTRPNAVIADEASSSPRPMPACTVEGHSSEAELVDQAAH